MVQSYGKKMNLEDAVGIVLHLSTVFTVAVTVAAAVIYFLIPLTY